MPGTGYPVTSKGGYALTRLTTSGSLVSVPNGQWDLHEDPRLQETTESDSPGTQFSPTVVNPTVTIRLKRREDPAYFEAIGWTVGLRVYRVWLQLGTASTTQKAHLLEYTIVGPIREVKNEEGTVIEIEVELHGGVLTRYQSVPAS